MNAFRALLTTAILSSPAAAFAGDDARAVVPYCKSLTPRICEIFVEYLEASPNFDIVPVEEREPGGDFLHVELNANWLGTEDLEGRIVWWGKSGSEHQGSGVVLEGAPKTDRAYANLVMLSFSGSGIPDPDSSFFSY